MHGDGKQKGARIWERKGKKMTVKWAETSEEAFEIQEKYMDKPHGWIQWKGTDVCMDVHCLCGEPGHVDSEFCYHVKCHNCGRVYFCNGHIELIEISEEPSTCVEETF